MDVKGLLAGFALASLVGCSSTARLPDGSAHGPSAAVGGSRLPTSATAVRESPPALPAGRTIVPLTYQPPGPHTRVWYGQRGTVVPSRTPITLQISELAYDAQRLGPVAIPGLWLFRRNQTPRAIHLGADRTMQHAVFADPERLTVPPRLTVQLPALASGRYLLLTSPGGPRDRFALTVGPRQCRAGDIRLAGSGFDGEGAGHSLTRYTLVDDAGRACAASGFAYWFAASDGSVAGRSLSRSPRLSRFASSRVANTLVFEPGKSVNLLEDVLNPTIYSGCARTPVATFDFKLGVMAPFVVPQRSFDCANIDDGPQLLLPRAPHHDAATRGLTARR